MSHEDAPTKRNVGPIPERGVLEAKVATLRNIVVRDCYETAEKLHMPDAMNRAEDFAQEAMMIALTKLDQYPDSGMTFPTWVKKIAINLVEGAAARKENRVTDQGEWDPNDTIGESHEWRSIHKVDGNFGRRRCSYRRSVIPPRIELARSGRSDELENRHV